MDLRISQQGFIILVTLLVIAGVVKSQGRLTIVAKIPSFQLVFFSVVFGSTGCSRLFNCERMFGVLSSIVHFNDVLQSLMTYSLFSLS